MSCFKSGYNNVHLFEQEDGTDGLYKNQIGAIGAALAHFSIKNDPALITMPTGTGKTAVMIVLAYTLKAEKVLVVTPSQLVREQIANTFRDPKVLVDKKIVPGGRKLPKVYELVNIIEDAKEWKRILKEYDVIVAIPGTLNKIPDLSTTVGPKSFDIVFVDEAHHSRANSWINILEAFSHAKQLLLTATPFRRDKKDIQARLIYNYPLRQAYEDGLFSKINFVPVKTQLFNTPDDKNIAIAKKADEVYKGRAHQEHRIIIRTDRKAEADLLHDIYSNHTSLNLVVVHSKLSSSTIKSRIKQLTNGEIDGVICVDMMGEGYDFPALKIAAVHIPHKSLAITLQFVGRISRTNTAEGNVATLIAGEHEFKIESHQLYKDDTKDWSILLPDLHKMKIQKTEDEQEFFDSFEDISEPTQTLALQYEEPIAVEDDDLLPFFHAKVYKVIPPLGYPSRENDIEFELIDIHKSINFAGTDALSNPVVRHHHVSQTQGVAVHIVAELKTPSWYIKDDLLKDIQNEFFVIYFDRDNFLLFICASIKETELYEHIAEQYLGEGVIHDMVHLPHLKRVQAGWSEPKLYNLGLKSRKNKGNSESYKQIMGSQAQEGVSPSDKYSYTRGHSFGGGYDTVLKKNVILGITSSSKVWSLDEKKIKYFVEWCAELARKIGDPEMDKLALPLSDLDAGTVVDEFPDVPVFFADWDAKQYYHNTKVVFVDADGEAAETSPIFACEINVVSQSKTLTVLSVSKNGIECRLNYTLKPKAKFEYAQDTLYKIAVTRGAHFGSTATFLAIVNETPINLFYQNLSKLDGKVLFEFNKEKLRTINIDHIKSHTWPANVALKKEFYTSSEITANKISGNKALSIHDYIIELAKREYDVVFYDHGSLEIADVIGLKKGKAQFWHCKKQDGDQPRCSVDDIYEVCGQAVKSVNWANRNLLIKQMYDRADNNNSSKKLKKGTLQELKTILESFDNPIIPVEITIVQPGLKTSGLDTNQQKAFESIKLLLSGGESFLQDVSSCTLSVLAS
ncbi:MAG: DEAD/DEAH box helicase family protein [Bacteroidetes bacterium]|nr:DEAD/DEAH box helicase family protein [Bacteroidota bacterium]